MAGNQHELELINLINSTHYDPLRHVMISYPWRSDKSIQLVPLPAKYRDRFNGCPFGPDEWACEMLDDIGMATKASGFDGIHAVDPIRYATVSGHGIGKSGFVAWIVRWIMDTRPLSKGTITATTDTQLRTKTWAELGKWHNRAITRHWFDYQASRGNMSYRSTKSGVNPDTGKTYPLKDEWFCTAQTCKEENSEAFAGQHAPNATSFYVFDEGSGVPDKIYEVREGGLIDGEPMIFDFGNGTKNTGRFFEECEGKLKHRYKVRSIDSRKVYITKQSNLHKQWEEDYGEDSDFFKVRVRGMFPSQASAQFMPSALVNEAMLRRCDPNHRAQLIIGIDVARFGDDSSVIYPRLGDDARSFGYRKVHGLDTVQITAEAVKMAQEFAKLGIKLLAFMVDGTGGSIGGAVGDQLRALGWPAFDVSFGRTSPDPKYRYVGDYIWGKLRDALPRLALPSRSINDQALGNELYDQLTQRLFSYMSGTQKIHLEPKSEMKDRGIGSPDIADALALTFAHEFATSNEVQDLFGMRPAGPQVLSDYNPLERKD